MSLLNRVAGAELQRVCNGATTEPINQAGMNAARENSHRVSVGVMLENQKSCCLYIFLKAESACTYYTIENTQLGLMPATRLVMGMHGRIKARYG